MKDGAGPCDGRHAAPDATLAAIASATNTLAVNVSSMTGDVAHKSHQRWTTPGSVVTTTMALVTTVTMMVIIMTSVDHHDDLSDHHDGRGITTNMMMSISVTMISVITMKTRRPRRWRTGKPFKKVVLCYLEAENRAPISLQLVMAFGPKGIENFCIGNKVNNLVKGGLKNIGTLAARSKQ